MNKKSFSFGILAGLAIGLVLFVIYSGVQGVMDIATEQEINFVEVDYESQDAKFEDILTQLSTYYFEDFDEEDLYVSAIKGFVDGVGDPYTTYYTKEEYIGFTEGIDGTYEGIGAYVGYGDTKDVLLIISPMEGSPAEKAGLEALDRILTVDGVEVSGMSTEELVKLIKGPAGTDVTIQVYRDRETLDIVVTRDQIVVPTIKHELLEDQIGYISIRGFDRVTYDQFVDAYEELEDQDQEGLIVDLRYNGGGLTNIVSAIVDVLLPEDLTIYYIEDKAGEQVVIETQGRDEFTKPLVILVNEASASASEIMAGAVQDHERGKVVGTTTFGKGLVQQTFTLDDGSALKITIAKYFTPDGRYIHGTGIEPDVIVELPDLSDEEREALPEDWDPQLDEAINVIKEMME
jgi:carboxyl-terminal processing protease